MELLAVALLGFTSFRSGEIWRDTAGAPIDAHGGGFLLALSANLILQQ